MTRRWLTLLCFFIVLLFAVQADRPDGFFQGRLKAFEVWLQFAGASPGDPRVGINSSTTAVATAATTGDASAAAAVAASADEAARREGRGGEVLQRPLEELPVVLQILLSQVR